MKYGCVALQNVDFEMTFPKFHPESNLTFRRPLQFSRLLNHVMHLAE